jgi:hypothetical protein
MGIANIINNSTTTSGGEIVRELVNSSDGAGLHLADGGKIELTNSAATEFGTADFSIEFVLNQTGDNTSDNYIYTSHTPGNNRLYIWNDISANKVNLEFVDGSGSATTKVLDYDMSADYGTPTHYVITCDRSGNATLYKNGNSVAAVDISSTSSIDIGAGNTNVGALAAGAGYGVLGTFYRFRTWNYLADAKALFERADVPVADQYGSQTELITNGNFAADSNWSKESGWTISGGKAVCATSSTNAIYQTGVAVGGNKYRVTYTISDYSSGGIYLDSKGGAAVGVAGTDGTLRSANGTYTEEITIARGGNLIVFRGQASTTSDLKLDDVSVVRIGALVDLDLAFANPTQSLMVQDRSGAADGTCSASGVTQVNSVVQGNLTSLRVGSGQTATPADNQVLVDGGTVGAPAYAFAHTTNTGMWSRGGGKLDFATGGVTRIAIDADGAVDIAGPPSHATALTVGNSTGGTELQVIPKENESITLNSAEGATAHALILATGGTPRLTVASTGLATFSNGITVNGAVGSFANGIYFSSQTGTAATGASTSTSVLNHYEEGTFLPNVGGNATYTSRVGRYTRVGRLVTCTFDMTINAIGTGSTNIVSGLPFATGDSIGAGGNVNYYSGLALSPVLFAPTVSGSGVQIRSATSAASSPSNHAIFQDGARVACIVTYTV